LIINGELMALMVITTQSNGILTTNNIVVVVRVISLEGSVDT